MIWKTGKKYSYTKCTATLHIRFQNADPLYST